MSRKAVKSCGVLVFREQPQRAFLVLRHPDRLDLPKGHLEEGESETACALRELAEETGLTAEDVRLEPDFRYSTTYYPRYRRFGGAVVEKTVVVFLGWLVTDRPIRVQEHGAFEWVPWAPPHRLGQGTLDGVLAEAERFFAAGR